MFNSPKLDIMHCAQRSDTYHDDKLSILHFKDIFFIPTTVPVFRDIFLNMDCDNFVKFVQL